MNYHDEMEQYEIYEEQFNPLATDRQARRKRKPKVRHTPKKTSDAVIQEIADTVGLEAGFNPTYQPQLFEQGWLLDALRPFYEQALMTDVLAKVKGGKEATVYRCEANPDTGHQLLAAKVYRPRMFRNLRNDKLYREGRAILKENGKSIKTSDHRLQRALGKKTALGEQLAHTSWLMHEFTTLQRLYNTGAAVPQPIAVAENAILMGYCGDRHQAAHTLNEVRLEADEAAVLFNEALRNVELMLQHHLIHGDLSAYNILYWEGAITLIDFPQVTDARTNPNARSILERDIQRLCEYFAAQGAERDAAALTNALWARYVRIQPDDYVPKSALDDLED